MAKVLKLDKAKPAEIEILVTGIEVICSYKVEVRSPSATTWKLIGEGVNSDPGSPGNDVHVLAKKTGDLHRCFLRWILVMDALDEDADPRYTAVVTIRQGGKVIENALFPYVDDLPKKNGKPITEFVRQTVELRAS